MKSSAYKFLIAAASAAAISACGGKQEEDMAALVDRCWDTALEQSMMLAENALSQEGRLPRTYEDGKLFTSDYHSWISGFFPGTLWELYEHWPENEELRKYAEEYTGRVMPAKDLTSTHDLGFMIFCSSGNAYRLTGEEKYRDAVLTAAESLASRYNAKTGVIMSWNPRGDWKYPVIIDNMMNLEMLMWAGRESGDSTLTDIALSHAETTLRNHFRDDFSSWHVVSYNPETGEAELKQTHQGYSDDSAWARGQAWALYGYTMMYRMSGRPEFLDQARGVADFIASHPNLPEDGIPWWDFDDPDIPNVPRDASAAAVMASAYLELSTLDKSADSQRWRAMAERQIRSLASPEYLAEPGTNGGFILKHSVGNMNKDSEVDVPLSYADYYFLEALGRLGKLMGK